MSKQKKPNLSHKHFILIPVLREQELVENMIDVFKPLSKDATIYFITTVKEELDHKRLHQTFEKEIIPLLIKSKDINSFIENSSGFFYESYSKSVYMEIKNKDINDKTQYLQRAYNNIPSTKTLLNKKIEESELGKRMCVTNYPHKEGFMAHQINYACEQIIEEHGDEVYVSIYNADSQPSANFAKDIRKYFQDSDIIQQSSLFLLNFQEDPKTLRQAFLKGNAWLQSRWTLAHELPRIMLQLEKNPFNFLEAAHVVGHGLTIKLKVLKDVDFFPTSFTNEDLPLGFLLRSKGYHINIYPQLENSENPRSIKALFTQYRNWFYGAFEYPQYLKKALKNYNLKFRKKIKISFWAIKGSIRSYLWLLSSLIWLFLFTYAVIVNNPLNLLLTTTSFINYAIVGWLLTFIAVRSNMKLFPNNTKLVFSIKDILVAPAVYFTHSIGPALGFFDIILSKIKNSSIHKRKTER